MGWWHTERAGQKLLQGDGPYDIMNEALTKITQEYEQDWGRKPFLAEMLQIIETVLAGNAGLYLADGEQLEIVNVKAKTRKRKKYQSFQVGDFFSIPLEKELFAFGRILSDFRVNEMGMLVGIYERTSQNVLDIQQLKGTKFMFPPFYCEDDGWKSWRWKIIGNIPVEPNEFNYPKYKLGMEGLGWQIQEGDKVYKATAEEVKNLEYATIWSVKAVEDRIKEYLKKR